MTGQKVGSNCFKTNKYLPQKRQAGIVKVFECAVNLRSRRRKIRYCQQKISTQSNSYDSRSYEPKYLHLKWSSYAMLFPRITYSVHLKPIRKKKKESLSPANDIQAVRLEPFSKSRVSISSFEMEEQLCSLLR